MVLADLFAADQAVSDDAGLLEAVAAEDAPRRPAGPPAPRKDGSGPLQAVPKLDEPQEAERLAVTVGQLQHALASRVRVEQAIGVLAERNGSGRARRSTCCAVRPGRAGRGSPTSPRTSWKAPPTRCSGCPTS